MAKQTRTERIAARVTPALREAVERAAERDRRSVSDWIAIVLENAVAASDAAASSTKKR